MMHLIRLPACATIREVQGVIVKEATGQIPTASPHNSAAVASNAPASPSWLQGLAGRGGRHWAGMGMLAGGALGALNPGKDEDGESRGILSGALRGGLAGGLAGGLGGMAAKRMLGPTGAQKVVGGTDVARANQGASNLVSGTHLQGVVDNNQNARLRRAIDPTNAEVFHDNGSTGFGAGARGLLSRLPFGLGKPFAPSDTQRAKSVAKGMDAFHETELVNQERDLKFQHGSDQLKAKYAPPAAPAAAAAPGAAPLPPLAKSPRDHLADIFHSAGLHPDLMDNPHTRAMAIHAHLNNVDIHPRDLAVLNTGAKHKPNFVPKPTSASAPTAQAPQVDLTSQIDHARASQFAQGSGLARASHARDQTTDQPLPAKPSVVPQEQPGQKPAEETRTAAVLNPTHVFSPIKKAARQPFKTPKKTVATRVNEAFTATPSKSVEAPKPPEPPKAVTPAKPADAITSTDKKDKTAEVTVPAIDVSSSAVSDALAAAPVVAAVADVAKVAEVVVPAAEPLIRPIKLAALAQ